MVRELEWRLETIWIQEVGETGYMSIELVSKINKMVKLGENKYSQIE